MPTDPRDYKLDLSSSSSSPEIERSEPRPYLSVHFRCCGVYCRIYRNADGAAYVGHCPRCAKAVRFLVAPGGSEERFFVVE